MDFIDNRNRANYSIYIFFTNLFVQLFNSFYF